MENPTLGSDPDRKFQTFVLTGSKPSQMKNVKIEELYTTLAARWQYLEWGFDKRLNGKTSINVKCTLLLPFETSFINLFGLIKPFEMHYLRKVLQRTCDETQQMCY